MNNEFSNVGSGIYTNVFTIDETIFLKKRLSMLPSNYNGPTGNKFSGINETHILYDWFCKNFFSKIQEIDGPQVKLLFASYLHEIDPWGIHSDYYNKEKGEPFKAYLIPLSVNDDIGLLDNASTFVFNEEDTFVSDEEHGKKYYNPQNFRLNMNVKENNALITHSSELTHCNTSMLEGVTVQDIYCWEPGSVIWWDEKLLHCSNNFLLKGVQSKQALVLHTYIN